jgi:hypothetical protein
MHLTAGAGSVVLLWGEPGDPLVELRHLKQPAGEIGPLTLVHDHIAGNISVQRSAELPGLLAAADERGLEVQDAAVVIHGPRPSRASVEKVRRGLERLVGQGVAVCVDGDRPKDPKRYKPASGSLLESSPGMWCRSSLVVSSV